VELVVQISWGLPARQLLLLRLRDAGRRMGVGVQRAGQLLPLLRYPEKLLLVQPLRARLPHDERNVQYLLGDYRPMLPGFPACCGIALNSWIIRL
jgi:hypothetical protein